MPAKITIVPMTLADIEALEREGDEVQEVSEEEMKEIGKCHEFVFTDQVVQQFAEMGLTPDEVVAMIKKQSGNLDS